MVDVTIKGTDDVDRLVRNIRANADSKALRRELGAGLNRATKPVRVAMKAKIPAALPKRGGLAARMQSAVSAGTTSARSGRGAGVSIRFRAKGYDIRTLTGGRLRHPVYGRPVWVTQTAGVNPEAFTGEFENQKPAVTRDVIRVMDEIARKVTDA